MQDILDQINRIAGVRGTVILGQDGLVVAQDCAGGEDPNTLGAIASSVFGSITKALERLAMGNLKRFIMTGEEGQVVLQPVGGAMLLTLVRKDANMGLVLVELKESAGALEARLIG